MASSRVMPSSSPSHTASDLARLAQAASRPGGGVGGGSGLGSMNLEELLRGIYGDMPTPAAPPASEPVRPMSPAPAPEIATQKTAEEVWKEITGGGASGEAVAPVAAQAVVPAGGAGGAGGPEMTLEDFLASEGAVKEDEVRISGPSAPVMGFLGGAEGVGMGGGGGGRGRKRQLMDPVDRAAMQRQKRMIKNRESAARSREVWKEITGGGASGEAVAPVAAQAVVPAGGAGGAGGPEMTLEDFLAREGAVKEDEVRISGPSAPVMGFLGGAEGVGMGGGGGGRGRKRQLMDPVDRAAMQRQKRMIKNRESAARSRERKQAYIAELESLVTQLEEENAELLREQEERHQKRLKELLEQVTPVILRKKPSRDLRRTNSMQW